MFGAKPNTFGFGNTSTPSNFGTATPFGQTAAATPAFNTPGAFGAQTPATSGLFGNTTGAASGLFGQQTAQPASFGNTSTGFSFGATPATTGGLFGQTSNTTGTTGLFATPATSTAFGTKTPSAFGGFGASNATANSTLFGATQNTAGNLFGQTSSTSLFGQNAQSGTTIKFNPPSGQDTMVKSGVTQNINTRHQCITAMKEYESKSLEELRAEDYAANRKGKQGASASLFSVTPAVSQPSAAFSFGQNKTGFGTSTAFSTGTTTTASGGLFGNQPQTATGLFGQNKSLFATTTASTTPSFGFGTTTSTAGNSLFGQSQTKPLFGAAATTTQSSLFGTSTSTAFGAASTPFSTPVFGATTQAAGALFAPRTALGTATTSAPSFSFGQTQSNLFAKPGTAAPAFGFGTSTSTAPFGVSTAGTSLFGNKSLGFNATATAPAFGTTLPAGGLFGAQNKPAFGTLGTSTSGFGLGTGLGTGTSALGGNSLTLGTSTVTSTGTNPTAQLQQQLIALTNSPYGDSPLFWNLRQSNTKREDVLKPTNPAAHKALLNATSQYKVSPRPAAKIKPKSLHNMLNGSKAQLFEGLEDEDFGSGNETFMPRKSVKKLVLKKSGNDSISISRGSSLTDETPNIHALEDDNNLSRSMNGHDNECGPDTENIIRTKKSMEPMAELFPQSVNQNLDDTMAVLNAHNTSRKSGSESISDSFSRDDDTPVKMPEERPTTPPPPHPAGLVLLRTGYYTVPNLEALAEMVDDNGDCFVEDFTIGRENYGSVFFPGITNVAGLNFDEIVHFRRKEIVVYPDDDMKPSVGEALNKKAEVTLDCVWPVDKSNRTPIKSPDRLRNMNYQNKIEEITSKIGAKFIDYRPETGSWVFEVKHFSKYGLVDDSDEEELTEAEKHKLKLAQQQELSVQKQKIQLIQQQQQSDQVPDGIGAAKLPVSNGHEGDRVEMPMMDDDSDLPDISRERLPQPMYELSDELQDDQISEQPASHRMATSMGVCAHSMQVMKASFFGDEDQPQMDNQKTRFLEQADSARITSPLVQGTEGAPSLFTSALKAKYMSPVKLPQMPQKDLHKEKGIFSSGLLTPEAIKPRRVFQPPVAEHILLSSGMTSEGRVQQTLGPTIKPQIPALDQVVTYQKQHLIADSAMFMGRSFRVGWGPRWMMAHSGSPVTPRAAAEETSHQFPLMSGTEAGFWPKVDGLGWNVTIEKVCVAEYLTENNDVLMNNVKDMLEIELNHSESTLEHGSPVFTPAIGVDSLHQYAKHIESQVKETGEDEDWESLQHREQVWNLCVALWGNLPEFKDTDGDKESYAYHQSRREAFSCWLSACAVPKIQKEIQECKYKGQGHLPAILSHLSGRQIAEACCLAQESGDHRLALLLAQSIGSNVPRQMIDMELNDWAELGCTQFISDLRLEIYTLLSGQLVWEAPGCHVNTCRRLDWKRALAQHLWFLCRPNATVQEVAEEYDNAFKGRHAFGSYCASPFPPYMESNIEKSSGDQDEDHVIRDTCYHLLKLYCNKSHRLERILNPITTTPNQLDYRLCWHLCQVLQALSYRHISPYHLASVHANYAAQLESAGLWHWAVFVCLHLEDSVQRESAVRHLLSRHITLCNKKENRDKEHFIQERLMVPAEWIHHAKAQRASQENLPHKEAFHLIKAGYWNDSHSVILKHISAEAIVNDQCNYLKGLLTELSFPARALKILDWHIGGAVFLDYITLCQKLDELKQQNETSPYELEQLQPEVISLCNRVGSLVCRNGMDRLCQSEMAKKCANLLRTLHTLQSSRKPLTRYLAPHIPKLPMPEDYCLQELKNLTRSYMLEMTEA